MRARILPTVVLALLVAVPALARPRTGPHVARSSTYTAPAPYQFVFEAGAALPFGDLGDDVIGTRKGLGAGTGYELGARFRYFALGNLAVGPSIHFADFGDWDSVDSEGVPYSIRTSVYRYGLELQRFFGDDRSGLRPYVTIGAALQHNRYEDWDLYEGTFRSSSTNLGFGVGAGLALGPMELSAAWHLNKTKNRFLSEFWGLADPHYDWSYVVVRAGFALGDF